jgi:glucose dehydrogenase
MVRAKRQLVLAFLGLAMAGVLTAAQRGGAAGQAPAAGGQVPAAPGAAQEPAAGGRGARGARGAAAPAAPAGLTITGEVPNFVPVTDEMLRKVPDGDWLMIRRDYSASDYSPLNQITPANVKDLQLVYMHKMNEGGTNQPAPIVHNGIIYLANTGGTQSKHQALFGKTTSRTIAPRGIAIYQDKTISPTATHFRCRCAHRKNVWSTNIGHSNSSARLSLKARDRRHGRLHSVWR